jgi:hypothetical protein
LACSALYLFLACFSHEARCPRGFFLHAWSAFASLRAAALDPDRTMLPVPENVALDGAPKIGGGGADAALHASAVLHGGGETEGTGQGESVVH